jgi:hypothetical protein
VDDHYRVDYFGSRITFDKGVVRVFGEPVSAYSVEEGTDTMTPVDAASAASTILEKWGFPVLVALAVGWVLRYDVLLPLVEEHRQFVKELSETQRDISNALNEQTRLLHVLHSKEFKHTSPVDQ